MFLKCAFIQLVVHAAATGADKRRVRDPSPKWRLTPLPWGSVRPTGWILDWADAARNGAVSPKNSWFAAGNGDNDRSNGWLHGRPTWAQDEQSAYWIDGMMRLGLVLNDHELITRAQQDIAAVIKNKEFTDSPANEGWPRGNYARAILAYFDATGDPDVLPFFESVWLPTYTMNPDVDARSMTQCEAMLEGYAFGGSETLRDVCLRGLASHEKAFLRAWVDERCTNFSASSSCFKTSFETEHGVSWNELAKIWGMASGWVGDGGNRSARYLDATVNAYQELKERDMLPIGINSAEEALSGIAPNASTETCDVADFIHSTTWSLRVTGQSKYGDYLERAFHNAAPAAVNRNWTQHVYFQSPNLQKIPHDYYRLPAERYTMQEHHDPACCTGNQARLLPNYIHHMWMSTHTSDGNLGLAAPMYGPNSVTAEVGRASASTLVGIDVTTAYPFETSVHMKLHVPVAGGVQFALSLRIPGWCSKPTLTVAGTPVTVNPDERGFHVVDRLWSDADVVELNFPMEPVVETRLTINNGGITGNDDYGDGNRNNYVVGGLPYATVSLGPLLFALPLEDGGKWQYALDTGAKLQVQRNPMPQGRWDWPIDAPVTIAATAHSIHWNDVWRMPTSPSPLGNGSTQLKLVPYGCTKVFRVSMFPHLQGDFMTLTV